MKRARHSGKIGDLIYSLPAAKALGVDAFALNADSAYGFTLADAEALAPLLRAQGWISGVEISSGEAYDVDLDLFRTRALATVNLADAHLLAFGLPPELRDRKWLEVPNASSTAPIIFCRTLRYRGIPEFWPALYER